MILAVLMKNTIGYPLESIVRPCLVILAVTIAEDIPDAISAPVLALRIAMANELENPTIILLESFGLYATDATFDNVRAVDVKYLSHLVLG